MYKFVKAPTNRLLGKKLEKYYELGYRCISMMVEKNEFIAIIKYCEDIK